MLSFKGCWPAHYKPGEALEENTAGLDPNHTHFIFVDDGTYELYDGQIRFRSNFEEHISKRKTVGGESRPLFVVVELSFVIIK